MIHPAGTWAMQDHNGQVLEQLAGDIIPVGVEGGLPGWRVTPRRSDIDQSFFLSVVNKAFFNDLK